MDSETITKLIEMFTGMGGDAKEAFIWYLVVDYGMPVIYFIIAIFLVKLLIKEAHKAVMVFTGCSRLVESYNTRGWFSEGELDDACRILREARKDK